MGKPTGLVKRKGSAVWYFRQRWPQHLKSAKSPECIWISLETADYATALTRLDVARQEATRRFHVRMAPSGIYSRSFLPTWPSDEKMPLLTAEQAAPLARSFFLDALREQDCAPQSPALADDEHNQSWRCELEDILATKAACQLTTPLRKFAFLSPRA